jgi:hypothetical protein
MERKEKDRKAMEQQTKIRDPSVNQVLEGSTTFCALPSPATPDSSAQRSW